MNDVERGQNNEENIIWKAPYVGENINDENVELGRKKILRNFLNLYLKK